MRTYRKLLLAVLTVVAFPLAAAAQERGVIAGRVIDASTRLPLPEVQVTIQGTTRGATTNQQGQYTIPNVPAGNIEVRASRIGYDVGTQRIAVVVGQSAVANFALQQTATELGAIVVTATGQEQRKREIGNAVTKIETENVELAAIPTISNLLQGRAPGVTIAPSSGTVGSGNRIRIRGASSVSLASTPLLIVDGVRIDNSVEASGLFTGGQTVSRFEDINPEDIESIEILKGPAASALYGTAAANGVIQITTKKGRRGTAALRVFAQRNQLNTLRSQVPDNVLARGRNAAGAVINCDVLALAAGTCLAVDSVYRYNPLFDSPNSPLRTGFIDKVGASISGGSENGDVTYYVSGEAEEGEGTVIKNEIEKYNFRANVGARITPELRINASSGFLTSSIELPQNDNSGSGIFLNALRGSPTPTNVAAFSGFNAPYNPLNLSGWDNLQDLRRFIGSVNADWRPLSWFSMNGVVGVDQANSFERSFVNAGGLPTGFLATGLREQYRYQNREFTATLNANAVRELTRNITSTTGAGVQYNANTFDWTYAAGQNITPGTKATAEARGAPQESNGGSKLFGIYASQQFGLADRLFVTAAIRGDQATAFGENIGFITYPAVSASWVVLEEPWFPDVAFLSTLRLRAAYGESGLRPGRLAAAQTFTDRAAAVEGSIVPGFVLSNLGNPELRAEISSEVEFGADVGFLDDRLGFEVTHYNKETEDALVRRPLPPSLGATSSQFFNLGSVENKGWEGTIKAEPVRGDRFGLNLRFNFTTNQNRLLSLGDSAIPPITFGLQRHVPGYPLAGYWAARYTFEDANSDGFIQRSEVTRVPRLEQDDTVFNSSFMGPAFPTRELSFSGEATLFRHFRISGLLDHKGGHKLFNWGRRLRCADSNTLAFCEERQVLGAASLEQQAAIQARQLGFGSAGFLEDADFWKLRELSLTWALSENLLRPFKVADGLSITLSGRNLATWTDYSGPDPEVNLGAGISTTDDPGRQYVADLLTMPAPRSFVIRVDATF